MAKVILYTTKQMLNSAFTNKKNMWVVLEKDEDVNELVIKLDKNRITDLSYPKVVRFLKERKILHIYKKKEVLGAFGEVITECKPYIRLYELELNQPFILK